MFLQLLLLIAVACGGVVAQCETAVDPQDCESSWCSAVGCEATPCGLYESDGFTPCISTAPEPLPFPRKRVIVDCATNSYVVVWIATLTILSNYYRVLIMLMN
jgi:hypothetical protein